jgi:methionyl-tRNA formyltransferase
LIDWNESAQDIFNKVRALNPFPGTWTTVLSGLLAGKRIKILKTQVIDNEILHKESGKVGKIVKNEGWTVLCAKGELLIKIVQPENKGKIKAWDFLQGGKFSIDDKLGCI